MKKIFLFFLFSILFLLIQSCEKMCTCTLDGASPTQLEIPPAEECGDYSSQELGDCK